MIGWFRKFEFHLMLGGSNGNLEDQMRIKESLEITDLRRIFSESKVQYLEI